MLLLSIFFVIFFFLIFVFSCLSFLFFFFFQAEDGIRDWSVTGVQTCALPISARPERRRSSRRFPPRGGRALMRSTRGSRERRTRLGGARASPPAAESASRRCRARRTSTAGSSRAARSEERRVGKGWRSRGVAG